MLLKPASHVLFIGDSITDCGRDRSHPGWESSQYLGDGYVNFVHDVLAKAYPDAGIRILNTGVGGDTVRELAARWDSDVLRLHPSWLSVMIGINDVWQHFDSFRAKPPVSLEEFRRTLEHLIGQVRQELDGLVMMTPYYLEPNRSDPMRSLMDRFGEVVQELALLHEAVFVDTQAAFDEILQDIDPYELAADKVHVNDTGHKVLAGAFLQGIGVESSNVTPGMER
ncbi:MAG: SGNH/GDSL hydrolase family protein [Anaerolineales bacterium]